MGSIKPDYIVRAVKNRQGKDKWTDIGVAYTSTKGTITVFYFSVPFCITIKR